MTLPVNAPNMSDIAFVKVPNENEGSTAEMSSQWYSADASAYTPEFSFAPLAPFTDTTAVNIQISFLSFD